mgnify:CR=1 FL=1
MKSENIDNCYGIKIHISDNSQVVVIGDVHSSFHSLYEIISNLKRDNFFIDDSIVLREDKYIIFTGDLIDYGPYGLEVLWFVFTLFYYNSENVIILKGNHENFNVYKNDSRPNVTFLRQLKEQFNIKSEEELKENGEIIMRTIAFLPTVVFLYFRNNIYQLNHGSINLEVSGYIPDTISFKQDESRINNFLKDDSKEFIYISNNLNDGLKWGDFYYNPNDHQQYLLPKGRGRDKHHINLVKNYLTTNNITGIISGHQDTTSVGLLPSDINTKEIFINTNEKFVWNNNNGIIVSPEKFVWNNNNGIIVSPDKVDNPELQLKKNKYTIPINLGYDVQAVTLSTAIPSKKVKFTTYGILK